MNERVCESERVLSSLPVLSHLLFCRRRSSTASLSLRDSTLPRTICRSWQRLASLVSSRMLFNVSCSHTHSEMYYSESISSLRNVWVQVYSPPLNARCSSDRPRSWRHCIRLCHFCSQMRSLEGYCSLQEGIHLHPSCPRGGEGEGGREGGRVCLRWKQPEKKSASSCHSVLRRR